MKVSLDLIVSVFSLSLLTNAVTRVDSFCSVAKSASTISSTSTSSSTESNTASFGISISSLRTTRLKSKINDGNESENGSDDKYKNMATNDIHKGRFEKESLNSSKRFATGEELTSLREDLESLRQNLEWARALKDESRVESLENAIRKGETLDPSFMYTKAQKMITETKKMKDASEEEKKIVIDKWTNVATDAREFLPQLNMEGLWVGK
jgi:anti-sigma28 factor (negative regulator of flagellin synthesis)